jgi:phage terminase large subunit-like protein
VAGRRRKRLVDLVRDGTFLARKDARLLAGRDELPWPPLDGFRTDYRAADDPDEAYEVARRLELMLREPDAQDHLLGNLRAELDKLGPRGSFERLQGFFPRFFRHFKGPRAGEPFHLDEHQEPFLREFFRRHATNGSVGRRVYDLGLYGVSKGSGKTPMASVLGTYATVDALDQPEVYCLSGKKDQADIAHEFARQNIAYGELAAWLVYGNVISCLANDGEFEIQSSDGDTNQGVNPTAGIIDEWWQFLHRKQREAANALTKALMKRGGESWVLGISTAGWTKASQLGEMYDDALAHPKLEVHEGGYLLVLRDVENGFLMHWYGAPDDADIEDPEVVRRANPAPWINPDDLLRDLHRPGTDEYDWRRLNLNQWTLVKGAWLPTGCWAGLRDDSAEVPPGAGVMVGVDIAHSYDTSSVAWAWRRQDGRIVVESKVWSIRRNVPAHEYVDDFYVQTGPDTVEHVAEIFIRDELALKYRILEIVGDPNYFGSELRRLALRFNTSPIFPSSNPMREAVQEFYRLAEAKGIAEKGDPVVAQHVAGIAGRKNQDGYWVLKKLWTPHPIDGGISSIIAVSRVVVAPTEPVQYLM